MGAFPALKEKTSPKSNVAEYADILQIGARNVQNCGLLKEIGCLKPSPSVPQRTNFVKELSDYFRNGVTAQSV